MTINLHVERLVLDSLPVDGGDARVIETVLRAELSRLLATEDVLPGLRRGGALPLVQAPPLALHPGGSSPQIGRQIARSVLGGLTRE